MKKVLFFLALGSFLYADPIKVAMDNEFPPFEYQKDGNIIGFDVDLATEISKRTGLEFQIVYVPYNDACAAINSGSVDIGISAFATDDATKDCDHGLSYFESSYVFIKNKNRDDIKNAADLKDKKVAYDRDSSAMKDFIIDLGARPIPKRAGTIIPSLLSLSEGQVDSVMVYDLNMPVVHGDTEFLTQNDIDKLKFISGGLESFAVFDKQHGYDSETFAIFPKDGRHEELKKKINGAILSMRQDGFIKKLLEKYKIN